MDQSDAFNSPGYGLPGKSFGQCPDGSPELVRFSIPSTTEKKSLGEYPGNWSPRINGTSTKNCSDINTTKEG
jgi:hypothetical protein